MTRPALVGTCSPRRIEASAPAARHRRPIRWGYSREQRERGGGDGDSAPASHAHRHGVRGSPWLQRRADGSVDRHAPGVGSHVGVTGVVPQHVTTAELPFSLLDQGGDRGRRRDGRLERQCLPVVGPALLGRRDGLGRGPGSVHDDMRVGRGQQRRDGLAHVSAATGDDRHLPPQVPGSLPLQ